MEILKQISDLIKSLSSNPYVGFLGILIGLISLIYAIYIARRDRRFLWLRYFSVSSNIILEGKTLYPKLDVAYDGNRLDNFTITKITIKNKGTEVIRPEHIAESDPIRITAQVDNGVSLLEYVIIKCSDEKNNFSLQVINNHTIGINFDFIEPEDSVTIQILHTGINSQVLKISGTVIGAKKPFESRDISDSPVLDNILIQMMKLAVRLPLRIPSRILVFISAVIGILVFGYLTRYFFLSSNLPLTCICSAPTLLSVFLVLLAVFRRRDSERESMGSDYLKSIIMRAMPEWGDESDE